MYCSAVLFKHPPPKKKKKEQQQNFTDWLQMFLLCIFNPTTPSLLGNVNFCASRYMSLCVCVCVCVCEIQYNKIKLKCSISSQSLFYFIFECFIYFLFIWVHCSCLPTHTKSVHRIPKAPCDSWELNSGPLQEKSMLLTADPSLQTFTMFIKCLLNIKHGAWRGGARL